MSRRWHIVTGEYPPRLGGVADYSRTVARGLAGVGDEVIVWAPHCGAAPPADDGVEVIQLPGHFGPRALGELDAGLARRPGRVLLQYTPHAFGYRAMNVPLCAWLWARCRPLDVMFHEVAYPFLPGQPLRHDVLAAVQRGMASLLLRAADRVLMSVPGWEPMLRRLAHYPHPEIWLPIPSNLPMHPAAEEVQAVRARLQLGPQDCLVGHFGTYGGWVAALLEPALRDLLAADSRLRILLIGQGSADFTSRFGAIERIHATGTLDPASVATHIGACDLMLQLYPGGISSRRSSSTAAMALGRPIVTTAGDLTEPIWAETSAVSLALPNEVTSRVLALCTDPAMRAELGRRAAELYRARFAVEHTIAALRDLPKEGRGRGLYSDPGVPRSRL